MTAHLPKPVRSFFSRSNSGRRGVVAVEFALLSTVLIALFAATLDLNYMIDAQRDAERASTLMVRTMSSCPAAADGRAVTWKGFDGCVTTTNGWLVDKSANILATFPTATVSGVTFRRDGSTITMCRGRMTNLDSAMQASALQVLKDQDVGMVVYVAITYIALIPGLSNFVTSGDSYIRQYTVDVQGNGTYFRCT